MKALIIDDERHARNELRRLLAAHPSIHVAGEAGQVAEAAALVARERPDLLFLDIQMPGATGFDLLATLEPPVPRVIFTTAYDEYALRAFDVNALDYLLKPVDPARLAQAVEKLAGLPAQPVTDPAAEPTTALGEDEQVFVREGDRCWFVAVRSIRLLESEGNYTRLHFDHEKPLLYRSLNSMEERLPRRLFFRANRSQIINLSCIEAIEPWFSGGLKVRLKGGLESELSRRQAQAFRERMSL